MRTPSRSAALLLPLLLPSLSAAGVRAGQHGTEPRSADAEAAAPVVKGADLDLLREVRELAERIARLRELPFPRVPLAVRAPREFREIAAEARAASGLPRERLEARGRAWADLGLGPATPAALVLRLAEDVEGMTFDPTAPRILVDPERLRPEDFFSVDEETPPPPALLQATGVRPDEPLAAHLLMHLHQHQRGVGGADLETTDAMLARAAWLEGEANLVAVAYLFQGMGIAGAVLETGIDPGLVLEGALLPAGLDGAAEVERRLLDFVYREGFARALEVRGREGWKGIDRAIAERRSTRSVLHLAADAGDDPRPPAAELEPPPGYALRDTDTLGEQVVVTLVAALTGKDDLGLQAGEGWRGDALYRWEREPAGPDARGLTLWITRWANAEDLADFRYGYVRGLLERHPAARSEVGSDGDVSSIEAAGRIYRFLRRGLELRVRVASPEVDRLLETERPPVPDAG